MNFVLRLSLISRALRVVKDRDVSEHPRRLAVSKMPQLDFFDTSILGVSRTAPTRTPQYPEGIVYLSF
jgi:hypothetical protein